MNPRDWFARKNSSALMAWIQLSDDVAESIKISTVQIESRNQNRVENHLAHKREQQSKMQKV